jgi:hypothetical protein
MGIESAGVPSRDPLPHSYSAPIAALASQEDLPVWLSGASSTARFVFSIIAQGPHRRH